MAIDNGNGNGNVEAHEEWCICSLFSLVQTEKEMKALPICLGWEQKRGIQMKPDEVFIRNARIYYSLTRYSRPEVKWTTPYDMDQNP